MRSELSQYLLRTVALRQDGGRWIMHQLDDLRLGNPVSPRSIKMFEPERLVFRNHEAVERFLESSDPALEPLQHLVRAARGYRQTVVMTMEELLEYVSPMGLVELESHACWVHQLQWARLAPRHTAPATFLPLWLPRGFGNIHELMELRHRQLLRLHLADCDAVLRLARRESVDRFQPAADVHDLIREPGVAEEALLVVPHDGGPVSYLPRRRGPRAILNAIVKPPCDVYEITWRRSVRPLREHPINPRAVTPLDITQAA